jgi:redox-regulated HSP33 family molecular chaperone
MSLATNTRFQMAEKLRLNFYKRFFSQGYQISEIGNATDGSVMVSISSAGTVIAACALKPFQFNGFQVVAELSASAAQGLPETQAYLAIATTQGQQFTAQVSMAVKEIGSAVVNQIFQSTVTPTNVVDDTLVAYQWGNDSILGASGN